MSDSRHCCDEMVEAMADQESGVVYVPKFREYGLRISDGGSSYRLIRICPWCGAKLPSSLRSDWFDALERMSIDASDEKAIPEEYQDDTWHMKP